MEFSALTLPSVIGADDVCSAVGSGSVGFSCCFPSWFRLPSYCFLPLFPCIFLIFLLLFILLCLLLLPRSVWCFFCSFGSFPHFILFPLFLILSPFLLFQSPLFLLHLPSVVTSSFLPLRFFLNPSCRLFWLVSFGCGFNFSFVCLSPDPSFFSVLAPLLSLVPLSFSLGSSTPASSSVIPFVAFVPLPPLSFRCHLLYFLWFLLCFLWVLLLQLHLLSSLLSPHFLLLLQCHLLSFVPMIPRSSADVSSVQGFSSALGGGGGGVAGRYLKS